MQLKYEKKYSYKCKTLLKCIQLLILFSTSSILWIASIVITMFLKVIVSRKNGSNKNMILTLKAFVLHTKLNLSMLSVKSQVEDLKHNS